MKLLICLAMSCGLTAILYFYLKQKILAIETRLNTLTDLAQTLATEVYHFQKGKVNPLENVPAELTGEPDSSDSDSSDSDCDSSDSDTETDCESDSENEVQIDEMKTVKLEDFTPVKLEFKPVNISLNELVIDISEPVVVQKSDHPIVVSDDEDVQEKEVNLEVKLELPLEKVIQEVKQIDVSTDYSNLTLKELKQQVLDLGGPPLKTKQALINFLKKKV